MEKNLWNVVKGKLILKYVYIFVCDYMIFVNVLCECWYFGLIGCLYNVERSGR